MNILVVAHDTHIHHRAQASVNCSWNEDGVPHLSGIAPVETGWRRCVELSALDRAVRVPYYGKALARLAFRVGRLSSHWYAMKIRIEGLLLCRIVPLLLSMG